MSKATAAYLAKHEEKSRVEANMVMNGIIAKNQEKKVLCFLFSRVSFDVLEPAVHIRHIF